MFQHILIPTDGSAIAGSAARQSIELAKALGARVTALTVVPRFHVLTYHTDMLEDTREQYTRDVNARVKINLDGIRRMAAEHGVRCDVQMRTSDDIDDAILEVAHEKACDAITIGSRGHHGLAGVFLGSVTQRVLAKSRVPVVVWH
jgi:nucleotide-binding universal stress UspA family protein